MEALLFKTNHRTTNFSKEEIRRTKRVENIKRTKIARDVHVQNNRKIPENLELTNDSINLSKSISLKKKVITNATKQVNKNKKPIRADLLKEWRVQKMKKKTHTEKSKKTPWRIAIHIEHKADCSEKENKSTKGIKKTLQDKAPQRSQRVLRESNANITAQPKTDYKPKQKQSYADWKKLQEPGEKITRKQGSKPVTKSEVNWESNRAVTRSMHSNNKPVDKNAKKTNKNNKKENLGERKDNELTELARKETETIESENVDILKEESIDNKDDLLQQETEENMFSIIPTSIIEHDEIDREIIQTKVEVVPLVTVKTEFQPPDIFNNFEFNKKSIVEAVDDFIPTNSDPAEAQLFKTNIPEIESETKENKSSTSSVESTSMELVAKTPVSLFKKEQGLCRKTPSSTPKRLSMSAKRASLTPNPMNFLHKNEDPIATRSETPKSRRSLVLTTEDKPAPVLESVESESVRHFTNLVAKEESKFRLSVDKWEKILEEKTAPEQHHGNILAAIGQAQLFMRKRFNQFKELIELHKDKSAEKAAHASDLDGFWEMIYYQVEDVQKRFETLGIMQKNGWVNEEEEEAKEAKEVKKPLKKIVKKTIKPKKTEVKSKVGGTSKKSEFAKFRQQMMAKKKAEFQTAPEDIIEIVTNDSKVGSDETKDAKIATETQQNTNDMKSEAQNIVASPSIKANEPIEEVLKSLRRSTRKTPSKYSSVNYQNQSNKKREDVACNLFESKEKEEDKENQTPDNDNDFTKYLSQTIAGGPQPVQRDLLTSFDTPVQKNSKPMSVSDDLMVFASPLPSTSNLSTSQSSSNAEQSNHDEDILLL